MQPRDRARGNNLRATTTCWADGRRRRAHARTDAARPTRGATCDAIYACVDGVAGGAPALPVCHAIEAASGTPRRTRLLQQEQIQTQGRVTLQRDAAANLSSDDQESAA